MMLLSEDQLNNLNKEALVIIVASLQDQLGLMQSQLDTANVQLADTNRQMELLTEQIRIMNQRQFGRQSEAGIMEGQLTLFNSFNQVEITADSNVAEPEISQLSSTFITVRFCLFRKLNCYGFCRFLTHIMGILPII